MSDEIDPVAISAWWAAMMFQAGTAVRDVWHWYERLKRERQRYPPNFQRILNGETRNGWRRILPCPEEIASRWPSENFKFYLVAPAVISHADEPEESTRPLRSSVMLDITQPLLDGRYLRTLRKCSLLRPAKVDLLHVRFDKREWSPSFGSSINFRMVAFGFQRPNTTDVSVQLVDVYQGKVREIMVTAPEEGLIACFAFATMQPKPRLHIVFGKYEDENRLQLSDAKYDIWSDGDRTDFFFRAISWESIIVPTGGRGELIVFSSGSGRVFFVCERLDAVVAENALYISFDRTRTWHVDTLAQWQSRMLETRLGASTWEAIEAFSKLPPPIQWVFPSSLPLKCHLGSSPLPVEGEIQFNGNKLGVMQRRLSTPSLKRVAVEDFFKAYPNVSLAAIKEATGVDVSDGVSEDGNNHAKVIDL